MKKSTAKTFGELIKTEVKNNSELYFFSPDETTSNKLDAIFESSERAWSNLPVKAQDLPESNDGRIIELLSENTLFAVMIGHIMAGEPAIMTSYESFFTIIVSQILQHLKFLDQSEKVSWRPKYPSVNLLSTSTCWRQDHNGFSHQSPMLVSILLDRPGDKVNCLFPVDSESAKTVFDFMMSSQNTVNLVTFNKTDEPQYIDSNHAKYQLENGASIFDFASDGNTFDLYDQQNKFDFVVVGAGDIATREALEAVSIIRKDISEIRIRFINILALSHNKIGTTKNPMSQETFDLMFTDAPIIANFHGYKDALKNIFYNYADRNRVSVHGFEEQGSTTTPFEMLTRNHASRFDIAIDIAKRANRMDLVSKYQRLISENDRHVFEYGEDLLDL